MHALNLLLHTCPLDRTPLQHRIDPLMLSGLTLEAATELSQTYDRVSHEFEAALLHGLELYEC